MQRVLHQVVLHHETDAQRLRALIAEHDCEGAFRIAHALKGMAGQIGATELQQAARDAEQSWRQDKIATQEVSDKLIRLLEETLDEIRTHLAGLTSGDAKSKAVSAAPLELARLLCVQLENADGAAIRTTEELRASMREEAGADMSAALDATLAAVERFDFDAATEKLQPIMILLERKRT